jgi:hypothetical protein
MKIVTSSCRSQAIYQKRMSFLSDACNSLHRKMINILLSLNACHHNALVAMNNYLLFINVKTQAFSDMYSIKVSIACLTLPWILRIIFSFNSTWTYVRMRNRLRWTHSTRLHWNDHIDNTMNELRFSCVFYCTCIFIRCVCTWRTTSYYTWIHKAKLNDFNACWAFDV